MVLPTDSTKVITPAWKLAVWTTGLAQIIQLGLCVWPFVFAQVVLLSLPFSVLQCSQVKPPLCSGFFVRLAAPTVTPCGLHLWHGRPAAFSVQHSVLLPTPGSPEVFSQPFPHPLLWIPPEDDRLLMAIIDAETPYQPALRPCDGTFDSWVS